jgi:hypothetical protein
MECAAICDVIAIIDSELKPQIEVAKAKLRWIVSILSTVCFSRPAVVKEKVQETGASAGGGLR